MPNDPNMPSNEGIKIIIVYSPFPEGPNILAMIIVAAITKIMLIICVENVKKVSRINFNLSLPPY
jgi:hypothetical protein